MAWDLHDDKYQHTTRFLLEVNRSILPQHDDPFRDKIPVIDPLLDLYKEEGQPNERRANTGYVDHLANT